MAKERKYLIKVLICSICFLLIGILFTGCSLETFGISTGGKSAYEIAVEHGFNGTEEEWLESLKGESGEYAGKGLSAYEIAVNNGFVGTEAEWLASLNTFEDKFQVAMTSCLTSVVSISAVSSTSASSGSGVIIEYDKSLGYAYVVTNFHVVCMENTGKIASKIVTYLYGREYTDSSLFSLTSVYVGGSAECDIAVLKVYIPSEVAEKTTITVAKIGDSSKVAVGSRVGAIGNAKGDGISLTSGVLSVDYEYASFKRHDNGATASVRVMRFDAYIVNGNSGGGLFNADGELIGVVNSKSSSVEFYYAIPINLAYSVCQNIINNCNGIKTEPDRLALGVKLSINDSVAKIDEETGKLYIKHTITVKSVHSTAMLKYFSVGDEILSVTLNGTTYDIIKSFDISDIMWKVTAGDSLTFKVKRDDEIKEINIVAYDYYDTTSDTTF